MQQLLDDVWEEGALLDELEALRDLIRPALSGDARVEAVAAIEELALIIEGRRAQLAEVAGLPDVPDGVEDDDPCMHFAGELDAEFSTTWQTPEDSPGTITGDASVDLTPYDLAGSAWAGVEEGARTLFFLSPVSDGYSLFFSAELPLDLPEEEVTLTLGEGVDVWFGWHGVVEQAWWPTGVLTNGTLTIAAGERGDGAEVMGSFSGDLLSW
jgi:hypothetical protein